MPHSGTANCPQTRIQIEDERIGGMPIINRERALNLLGALATASVTAVGFAIGGKIAEATMVGIGINLASHILASGSAKLKERWLSSTEGIRNHDIQLALNRAFKKA